MIGGYSELLHVPLTTLILSPDAIMPLFLGFIFAMLWDMLFPFSLTLCSFYKHVIKSFELRNSQFIYIMH